MRAMEECGNGMARAVPLVRACADGLTLGKSSAIL